MTQAEGHQQQLEQRQQEEESLAAHYAMLASITEMFSSRARGYGSGQTYEYCGPEVMGSNGNFYREQRLK